MLSVSLAAAPSEFQDMPVVGDLVEVETASADYQENCITYPDDETRVGREWRAGQWISYTYTVTVMREYCHRHWHKHVVQTILLSTAVAVQCAVVGAIAAGLTGGLGIGAGIACTAILTTVQVVWGPSH